MITWARRAMFWSAIASLAAIIGVALLARLHWQASVPSVEPTLSEFFVWWALATERAVFVGVASASIALVLGITLGLGAAFGPSAMETLTRRAVEFGGALPLFALVTVTGGLWSGAPEVILVVAVGTVRSLEISKLVRGLLLGLRHQPMFRAARHIGSPRLRTIRVYGARNLATALTPSVILAAAYSVSIETTLSYLGLATADTPSWGAAIARGMATSELGPHALASLCTLLIACGSLFVLAERFQVPPPTGE